MAADIGAIGQAVSGISQALVTTIAGIGDAKKQQQIQSSLDQLSAAQQKELSDKVLAANSENQRLATISEYLTKINIQRINNLTGIQSAITTKTTTKEMIVIGAVVLIAVVAIVVIIKRK